MDRRQRPVGKNQLCPCGSGRKYKLCCISKERVERTVVSSTAKCDDCGTPLVADFTENPLFQILNYQRPLRFFMR